MPVLVIEENRASLPTFCAELPSPPPPPPLPPPPPPPPPEPASPPPPPPAADGSGAVGSTGFGLGALVAARSSPSSPRPGSPVLAECRPRRGQPPTQGPRGR